jgi:hypothetical protein
MEVDATCGDLLRFHTEVAGTVDPAWAAHNSPDYMILIVPDRA